MKTTLETLLDELQKSTQASVQNCTEVAERLSVEINRVCAQSKRIQSSGEVDLWANSLVQHRLQQCLNYYNLGSKAGRAELHSTLSSIVYRYITPVQLQSSYQARLNLIEDFLQSFYLEALNAFRRENKLPPTYQPRTKLELAEYMAFVERYGKRRIPLSNGRSQQLIILRAQTFSQQQPQETSVDIEQASEGTGTESDQTWNDSSVQGLREVMVSGQKEPEIDSLRQDVISELMKYLEDIGQKECADYFTLRLQDLPTNEIESILGLTPRQRDYLQQKFKYHLLRFSLSHKWELVHQWLDADLDRNLGMTPQQWEDFIRQCTPDHLKLLKLKKQRQPDEVIAKILGCTINQVQKRWYKLLEIAWDTRNREGGTKPS